MFKTVTIIYICQRKLHTTKDSVLQITAADSPHITTFLSSEEQSLITGN